MNNKQYLSHQKWSGVSFEIVYGRPRELAVRLWYRNVCGTCMARIDKKEDLLELHTLIARHRLLMKMLIFRSKICTAGDKRTILLKIWAHNVS
jgi:hypothetical protein